MGLAMGPKAFGRTAGSLKWPAFKLNWIFEKQETRMNFNYNLDARHTNTLTHTDTQLQTVLLFFYKSLVNVVYFRRRWAVKC